MKKLIFIIVLLVCAIVYAAQPYRILNSFNGGELSPLLIAREDIAKYHTGCETMENVFPLPQGGAQKRPGTVYVATAKDADEVRVLPFQFSTTQSYVIEAGNQYMRFFTSNAPVLDAYGTEDLSGIGSIIAHWKCDDNAATKVVVDADGATHNGATQANTSTLTTTNKAGTANTALELGDVDYITVGDHGDFSFGDGSDDSPFSIAAWVYYVSDVPAAGQRIISKSAVAADSEWYLGTTDADKVQFLLYDESVGKSQSKTVEDALATATWYFIVATYDGRGGDRAVDGMNIYIDWVLQTNVTVTAEATYDSMEDKTADVVIGAHNVNGAVWVGKVDNVAMFSKELSAAEVASLTGSASTNTYTITTPYLTADLFELKYEQSADVLYITHPDYETKKLSRLANNVWTLEAIDITNGPFRTQNDDTAATISASATTGSVTLTAVNCTPFISGTTAGHLPSGALSTSKSQTGALFKLVHPLDELEYHTDLEDNYTNSQVEDVSWTDCGTIYKGGGWRLTTDGTWDGTLEVQRNYTIGAAHGASGWEVVYEFSSSDDRNTATALRTEDDEDADYRVILTASGDAAEDCEVYFSTDQTEVVGIVEITAVASTTSATGTVIRTLGSTDATYKWSEGSWSNYRGWPQTVAFFEDRLIFGGNTSQPDTIWGSVTGDYENMLEGVNDADAIAFTLTSRQVNAIQWIVGKDKILIGTSGAEWTMQGSSDEPLTPSNVKAEQHSTYGSEDLQATLANESILFFQRGGKRMRELAYNWESDAYVAPDMTILAKEVTGDGITDTGFQQIPDSMLWCVREDGEIATFTYERKEGITAWARQITDGDFESVAVINGTEEDQVWVSVQRDINSDTTARYIEYFKPRDFGTDLDDAYYVDSGYTYDSDATTSITELGHLIAETVSVFGDSVIQTSKVVDASGDIAITSALTVQTGLPYTVQMKTMPLSWVQGQTIHGKMKKVSEVISSWYNSGDFSVGKDATTLQTYSISGMTTNEERITFPPGWDRYGQVFIYQASPEPLTLIALMMEYEVE